EMVGYSTRTTNNAVGACLGEEHIPATRVSSNQARGQRRVIVDGRADYDTVSGAVLDLVDEVGDCLADADTGTSRTGRSLSYTHTSRCWNDAARVQTIVHWNTPVIVAQHHLKLENVMSREGRSDCKVGRVYSGDPGTACACLRETGDHSRCQSHIGQVDRFP